VTLTGVVNPLDVAAAWTDDQSALTVGIVNPTTSAKVLQLNVQGATLTGHGQKWCITGPDRWAHNTPEQPQQVTIQTTAVVLRNPLVEVAPLSITLYAMPVQ
jgi:alpha-L-arabinofuranosidase